MSRSLLALLACGSRAGCPGRSAGFLLSTSTPADTAPSSRTSPSPATASIWSRPPTTRRSASGTGRAGATIRTLRGFVGPGNDGKIFAVAVSPDGKTIAAGGYFGAGLGDKPPYGDIRLFDFATGKVKATLKAARLRHLRSRFLAGRKLPCGRRPGRLRLCLAARRGGSDRLESRSPGSTPIPGTSSNWPSPMAATGWSRRPPTTASGCGICLPATEIAMRRRRAAARPAGDGAGGIAPTARCLRPAAMTALSRSAQGCRRDAGAGDAEAGFPDRLADLRGRRRAAGRLLRLSLRRQAPQRRLDASPTASRCCEYRGHDGTVYASATSPDGTLVATAGGTQARDPALGPADRRAEEGAARASASR